LRVLTDVSYIPSIAPDGRVFDKTGYDTRSGVLFQLPEDCQPIEVSSKSDHAAIVEAIRTLWKPWSEFPFAEKSDRAAMFAAVLMRRNSADAAYYARICF